MAASGYRGGSANPMICCPDHPDAMLIEDHRAGDQICSDCGLVVGDRVIDVGSEWRSFSNDKNSADPSRVGGPENPLLDGCDLSTIVGPSTSGPVYGMAGAGLPADGATAYRNRRTMSSSDRSLLNAFKEIANMGEKINLPRSLLDRANALFKDVHTTRALRGRSNDAIASACLYIACRQDGVPRTFKEIVAVSSINKKEIGRCFKLILKALETSVDLITTNDFMFRFCSNLGLDNKVQKAATHIADTAGALDIVCGRSPVSVAAAAIYMATQASARPKTPAEIGEVLGVAEITIRQAYKLMIPRAKDLFPKDFVFHTSIEKLPAS
ncbi:transcription initiation factor IIB-like [Hyalella azteca]|uniref:Transcription initiation factor IIB n=1 Tax=Hyalella azteca TaxID=294128 RepID=A0A8B7PNV4_HYAAZ|nr:transcription initiation factor IIB-like [Hyalella azteca]